MEGMTQRAALVQQAEVRIGSQRVTFVLPSLNTIISTFLDLSRTNYATQTTANVPIICVALISIDRVWLYDIV